MTGTLEYKGRQRYIMLKGKTLTICKTKAATDETETGTRALSVQQRMCRDYALSTWPARCSVLLLSADVLATVSLAGASIERDDVFLELGAWEQIMSL
jgi:hypothetical protein